MYANTPLKHTKDDELYLKVTQQQANIALALHDTYKKALKKMYSAGIRTEVGRISALKELFESANFKGDET